MHDMVDLIKRYSVTTQTERNDTDDENQIYTKVADNYCK